MFLRLIQLCCCFLLLLAAEGTEEYHCSHKPGEQLARVHLRGAPAAGRHSALKRSVTNEVFNQTFRVSAFYDGTFSTGLSSQVQSRIRDVIKNVTDFLQMTLSVRQTPSPILLDRNCAGGLFLTGSGDLRACYTECRATTTCNTATIPQEHLLRCLECGGDSNSCSESGTDGAGVSDADFLLYVAANSTFCSSSTIAFAGACQLEDQYDRPIAGSVNFCSEGITSDKSDQFIFNVVKHEILHALGFSFSLFPWFRDENGNPRTGRDSNGFPPKQNGAYVASNNTVRTVTYNDWWTRNGVVSKTVTIMVTPKVVETGRQHFNCSTLEGVQLEDQGGSGTALSHWETRILENEGMTGIISSNPVFSNITLALLEDSGWYKADYSKAGQLVWGRGDGCGYTAGSCGGYIHSQLQQNKPIAPFCNRLNGHLSRYSCNVDRSAISFCNLAQYSSSLPAEYQYFNSGENFPNTPIPSRYGSSNRISDYCPYHSAFSNTHCANASHSRGTGLSNPRAETYGEGSRCVEHSTVWVVNNVQRSFVQSGCYKYRCSNGTVTIFILGQPYVCNEAGQVLTVNQVSHGVSYSGTIICPSCLEICYDDFQNCPEAAALYGVEASTTSTASTSNSATTSSTATPSSNAMPTSIDSTSSTVSTNTITASSTIFFSSSSLNSSSSSSNAMPTSIDSTSSTVSTNTITASSTIFFSSSSLNSSSSSSNAMPTSIDSTSSTVSTNTITASSTIFSSSSSLNSSSSSSNAMPTSIDSTSSTVSTNTITASSTIFSSSSSLNSSSSSSNAMPTSIDSTSSTVSTNTITASSTIFSSSSSLNSSSSSSNAMPTSIDSTSSTVSTNTIAASSTTSSSSSSSSSSTSSITRISATGTVSPTPSGVGGLVPLLSLIILGIVTAALINSGNCY